MISGADEHRAYLDTCGELQGAREGAVSVLTDGVAARLAFRGHGDLAGDSEAIVVEINIESSFFRPGSSKVAVTVLDLASSCTPILPCGVRRRSGCMREYLPRLEPWPRLALLARCG